MRKSRLILIRAAVIGMSCIVSLAGLEVFLRFRPVVDPFLDTAIEAPRLSPLGEPEFRLPVSPEKQPHVFRIVTVGDSYTVGSGVYPEDAYPKRLEARLRQLRPTFRIEVVSWARPGWNTSQELSSFRLHVEELDPDLLLIGFTLNDVEPTNVTDRKSLRTRILPRSPKSRLGRWARTNSVLFESLWASLENIRLRGELADYYRRLHADGPGLAECRRALRGFKRIARQRGIPLLVVVFPIFDSQLDHRYRYRDSHAVILELLQELGIGAIDLLPYYESVDGRRLAVTPFTDPHPNELGHRIAADAILRHLSQQRLLPESRPNAF